MYKYLFIIFFTISCIWVSHIQAQVLAPDFVCVKNDTLIWTPATNSCGTFQSFDIYFSSMLEGPYTLLEQITDPLQTTFFHNNPADLQFFYFLESNYDCPGQNPLQSDTLDNRSPEIPEINSLSTIGNTVVVNWLPSLSPQTVGYIIFRQTTSGTIPIDTVFNDFTYIDLNANPQVQDETYFVLALDPCENTSLFGEPQTTYRLNAEIADCLQEIRISWTPTNNFENGIARQEVWLGENGAAPVRIETLTGNDTFFTLPNIVDGVEYCFFIRAVSNIDEFEVNSNTVCIAADIVNPVRELYMTNVDFINNEALDISWGWNENAAIQSAVIQGRRIENGTTLQNPIGINSPLQRDNTQNFNAPDAGSSQWEFQIMTVDLLSLIHI